jgi:Domain of unknown function (DUF4157)
MTRRQARSETSAARVRREPEREVELRRQAPVDALARLQQTVGNAAVEAALRSAGVRLHADGGADELLRGRSALALTRGRDVYLSPTLDLAGERGRAVLAHELAHVVQQTRPERETAPAALEAEAQAIGAGAEAEVVGGAAFGALQAWSLFGDDEEEQARQRERRDEEAETAAKHLGVLDSTEEWKRHVDDPLIGPWMQAHPGKFVGNAEFQRWAANPQKNRPAPPPRAPEPTGQGRSAAAPEQLPASSDLQVEYDKASGRQIVSFRGRPIAAIEAETGTELKVDVVASGDDVRLNVTGGPHKVVSLVGGQRGGGGGAPPRASGATDAPRMHYEGEPLLVEGASQPPQQQPKVSAAQAIGELQRQAEKRAFLSWTPEQRAAWARAQVEEVRRRHIESITPKPGSFAEAWWTLNEMTGLHSFLRAWTGETQWGQPLSGGERFSEAVLGTAQSTQAALAVATGLPELGPVAELEGVGALGTLEEGATMAPELGQNIGTGGLEAASEAEEGATLVGSKSAPNPLTSEGSQTIAGAGVVPEAEEGAAAVPAKGEPVPPESGASASEHSVASEATGEEELQLEPNQQPRELTREANPEWFERKPSKPGPQTTRTQTLQQQLGYEKPAPKNRTVDLGKNLQGEELGVVEGKFTQAEPPLYTPFDYVRGLSKPEMHHFWPKYLRGLEEQTLGELSGLTHDELHASLVQWKGGMFNYNTAAPAYELMQPEEIFAELREFYATADQGRWAQYAPDFERAAEQTLKSLGKWPPP